MVFIRSILKLCALFVWFPIIVLLTLPFQFRGIKSAKRITRIGRLWARGVARIIGLEVEITGQPVRENGGVIVSNHLGYVDIITHASIFNIRHSPKSDIAGWPLLGAFISVSHPIWIDRSSRQASRKTSEEFINTVNNGMNLIVYPEGTSSDGREGILPFKSTPFEAAVAANAPVIPVLTQYFKPDVDEVCWYGDMEFIPHVRRLLGVPSIKARVKVLPPVFPEGRGRKELSEHVYNIMQEEYAKIEGANPVCS